MSPVLEVEDLRTYFFTTRGVIKAVDGVSFTLEPGESLGLVGESGCGKSMTLLSLLRLVPQPGGQIVSGRVLLQGQDLLRKNESEMRKIRGAKIAIVLQDPLTSLNPAFSIGFQVGETIHLHQKARGETMWRRAVESLRLVNIPSPETRLRDFPHQLSGGMRQRVVGAMALCCEPVVLLADEPTTSLDVTIQAQYLELFENVRRTTNVSMIFVTHDLGIVATICDRVAVMYAGRVVEHAPTRLIFNDPRHPYTTALMQCLPKLDEYSERLASIEGQPPDLSALPAGCYFAPRCQHRRELCEQEYPPRSDLGGGHQVNCWLAT